MKPAPDNPLLAEVKFSGEIRYMGDKAVPRVSIDVHLPDPEDKIVLLLPGIAMLMAIYARKAGLGFEGAMEQLAREAQRQASKIKKQG